MDETMIMRLWDIHHDVLVAEFGIDLGPDQIPTLQLSPDQRALHYVEASTLIRRFPLDLDELVAMGRHAVTRELTHDENRRHGFTDDAT